MDQNLLDISLGVTSEVIATYVPKLLRTGMDLYVGEELIESMKEKEKGITSIIGQIQDLVSEQAETSKGIKEEELALFVSLQEIHLLIKNILTAQYFPAKKRFLINDIKTIFFNLFKERLDPTSSHVAIAEKLWELLIHSIEGVLNLQILNGSLVALDTKDTVKFKILAEQLESIKADTKAILNIRNTDLPELRRFEDAYKLEVANRCDEIKPFQSRVTKKLPLEQLYVSPKVLLQAKGKGQPIPFDEFAGQIHRSVLLGDPGAGKSTLSKKICVANGKPGIASRVERNNTIFLVILREYAADKKNPSKPSILEYIKSTSNSRYSIQPPPNAIEFLLSSGRATVIFDGLDELLNTSERKEIKDDVESFSRRYPNTSILVTSRKIGYDEAPLDDKIFSTYQLGEFDDEDIEEYVNKWFNVLDDLMPEEKEKKATSFLQERDIVGDLCANPLLLGLMCSIYREINYIPRNRPEVYKKCTELLFENWDSSRDIPVAFTFDDQVRPIITHLAYWIYSSPIYQKRGVTETQLVSATTKYYYPSYVKDRDVAERTAKQFITFCKGRAWIFSDQGITPEGEDLYLFSHQTFLEYFTALFLTRNNDTTKALFNALKERIAREEWDVVATLAFHIRSKETEKSEDLLSNLIKYSAQKTNEEEQAHLIGFAVRCLVFMSPSLKVRKIIFNAVCRLFLSLENRNTGQGAHSNSKISNQIEDLLVSLKSMNDSCLSTFEEHIVTEFRVQLRQRKFNAAVLILETILALSQNHYMRRRSNIRRLGSEDGTSKRWRKLYNNILQNTDELRGLIDHYAFLARELVLIAPSEAVFQAAINSHGPSILTRQFPSEILETLIHGSIFSYSYYRIHSLFRKVNNPILEETDRQKVLLSSIGRYIIDAKPIPNYSKELWYLNPSRFEYDSNDRKLFSLFSGDALFGAIVIMLSPSESIKAGKKSVPAAILKNNDLMIQLQPLMNMRHNSLDPNLESHVETFPISSAQKKWLLEWANGSKSIFQLREKKTRKSG